MYAAVRQGKARAGAAAELAARIKEGGDPDHQRRARLPGLLRGLCPGRHVTAISIFDYARPPTNSNRRGLPGSNRMSPRARWARHRSGRASNRAHLRLALRSHADLASHRTLRH